MFQSVFPTRPPPFLGAMSGFSDTGTVFASPSVDLDLPFLSLIHCKLVLLVVAEDVSRRQRVLSSERRHFLEKRDNDWWWLCFVAGGLVVVYVEKMTEDKEERDSGRG